MTIDPNKYVAPFTATGLPASDAQVSFLFLLFPGFPMMAFTAMVDPLRAANGLIGRQAYTWATVAAGGGTIEASNGQHVTADFRIKDAPNADRIVVCSGGDADRLEADAALGLIRKNQRKGAMLGAVADGAFLLARAGLLDGFACTLHWTSQTAFAEVFPEIELRRELFVIDRNRFTSAGGIGGLDMTLELIERDHSAELANGVAEWFVHRRPDKRQDRQHLPLQLRTGIRDMLVLSAVQLMETSVEEGIKISEICARLSVTADKLERSFRAETDQTPSQYLRNICLSKATDLLIHSTLQIREIALTCGYTNLSSFSRMFKDATGITPSAARQQHLLRLENV